MIQPPKNCPSCQSTLEWQKDQLYCRNLECPAKSNKQLEHFAKTLKIKGLGPSTIEKLEIYDINDIYEHLTVDYVTAALGSEKLAIKLLDEIEKSKDETLNTVLPAFGISLVGKSATDKLSQVCESIFDIDEDSCKKAGLGQKVTENLLTWMENKFDHYCGLPFSFEFSNKTTVNTGQPVICITGKLTSYKTKAEAEAILKELGYTVKADVTKDVTLLVNESGRETAKTIKAANNGVHIINNLKEYLEN